MPDAERRDRAGRLWHRLVARLRADGLLEPGAHVLAFHGFGDEPPTDELFPALRRAGATLLLPRVEADAIVPVVHPPEGDLQPSPLGVPEPTGPPVAPTTLDVVVVPGLAFDRRGHRLGYGVGFYDRFLAILPPAAATVGVCLASQLVDRLPVDEHDVPVGLVVTDRTTVQPPGT